MYGLSYNQFKDDKVHITMKLSNNYGIRCDFSILKNRSPSRQHSCKRRIKEWLISSVD